MATHRVMIRSELLRGHLDGGVEMRDRESGGSARCDCATRRGLGKARRILKCFATVRAELPNGLRVARHKRTPIMSEACWQRNVCATDHFVAFVSSRWERRGSFRPLATLTRLQRGYA